MYYSDAEDGNKPESETDDIIDNTAKRILDDICGALCSIPELLAIYRFIRASARKKIDDL